MEPIDKKRKSERRGRLAEEACVFALRLKAYRILAQRVKGLRGRGVGELDIVARKGDVIAFIEVKARRSAEEAAESLGRRQQNRIIGGARLFLAQNPQWSGLQPRFDAMLVAPWRWPVHVIDAWRIEE